MRTILYIFDRKEKKNLLIIVLLSFMAAAMEVLGVSAMLPLINAIVDSKQLYEKRFFVVIADLFSVKETDKLIILLCVGVVIIYLIKNFYLMIQFNIRVKFSYRNRKRIATRLMRCYLSQPYLFHVEHNVAELERNINTDVFSFFQVLSASISIIVEGLTVILIVAYLFWLDPFTTALLGIIICVLFFVMNTIYKSVQVKAGERARDSDSILFKWVLQAFGGIKEVKILGMEGYFYDKFLTAYNSNIDAHRKFNILSQFPQYILEMIYISGLIMVICIKVVGGGDLSSFMLTISAFVVAAIRLLPSVNRITVNLSTMMFGKSSIDSIYNDLTEADHLEKLNLKYEKPKSNEDITFNKHIDIRNVTFRYPSGNKNVLDNASFRIHKNSAVAIVGESGAGKSTLMDILLGVIEPQTGNVCIDDIDIAKSIDKWHDIIGYIPQQIYLLDDSIRNNVLFGRDEEDETSKRIWELLDIVKLKDYVSGLDEGIDTVIGEQGARLSGGQRQRLGIARALYHKPEVLVMDEATSSLDMDTEKSIIEAVEHLHGNTTLIIVAHRLTTIQFCDVVYEVKNGAVLKRGRFDGKTFV